jgi:hypothetical protein
MRSRLIVALAFGVASSAARSAAAAIDVRIVEPGTTDILYGKTRIAASVSPAEDVAQVRFRLDRFPNPICVDSEPPFLCTFDAGKAYQGRRIQASAIGKDGQVLGRAVLDTLDFTRPTEVRESTLVVPVVAESPPDHAPDLSSAGLDCSFGGKPCTVVGARRLGEDDSEAVSLEVLVDVSRSMDAGRQDLVDALHYVLDQAPGNARVSLSEFSGTYRTLTPFTRDREKVKEAVESMSYAQPYTCLLAAIRKSLFHLQTRRGHRALFVITDGEETCEISAEGESGTTPFRVDPGAIQHTLRVARQVGAPLYIYHVPGSSQGTWGSYGYARLHEGIAAETGGRLFGMGDLSGVDAAMKKLVQDLRSMWLVDLDLPRDTESREVKRLEISMPGKSGVALHHPEYLMAGSRLEALLAMIDDDDGSVRAWGASRLGSHPERRVLQALRKSVGRERDPDAAAYELSALYLNSAHMLLHGGEKDQEAALAAIEDLLGRSPILIGRLLPALRVYLKTAPRPKLRARAERCLTAATAVPEEAGEPSDLLSDPS